MVVDFGYLDKIFWPITDLVQNQSKWLNSTDFSFNLKPAPASDMSDGEYKDVLNTLNVSSFVACSPPSQWRSTRLRCTL